MSKTIKKCVVCGRRYRPDPRTAKTQKACPRRSCRSERIRRKNASWLKRHPLYGRSRRFKIRAWAKAYPDYWQAYRAAHPQYRLREIRRMSVKRREVRRVAKQTATSQIAVEKLNALEKEQRPSVAKQTAISRRLDRVVEYLLWREGVAKQTAMAPLPKAGDTEEDEDHPSREPGRFSQHPRASRGRLPKKLPP